MGFVALEPSMSGVLYWDSPEAKRMRREQRIHELPGMKGATAVHLVFNSNSVIVDCGKLSASMVEARRLVHLFMEQYDDEMCARYKAGMPPLLPIEATLAPITAKHVKALQTMGALMLSPAEYRARYEKIVQTCYATIRDCDDPHVRMQAAHLLQSIGDLPKEMQ